MERMSFSIKRTADFEIHNNCETNGIWNAPCGFCFVLHVVNLQATGHRWYLRRWCHVELLPPPQLILLLLTPLNGLGPQKKRVARVRSNGHSVKRVVVDKATYLQPSYEFSRSLYPIATIHRHP